MGQRRIQPGEIEIGSILPWDVYDDRGRLLLRAGHEVGTENQIERLIEHGLFAEVEAEPTVRPLTHHSFGDSAVWPILEARRRLENLCTSEAARAARFAQQVLQLCELIGEACALSQDAALATAIFERKGRYSIMHSMDVAITCHVVGRSLELDDDTLNSTVAAALTMNLSVLDLQDELQSQKERLSSSQREVMSRHPQESAAILAELGVSDPVWLDAVRWHHEALDGSGYSGKKGEEISLPAQLVSLADVYCARISSRKYRRALRPNAALRAVFMDQGKKVSQELAGRFIKAIGIFPAGTPVKLENGEIAVVTSRGEKPTSPQVCSIVAPHGMPFVKPVRRDTSDPAWRVREVMEWNDVGAMPSMQSVWGKVAAVN